MRHLLILFVAIMAVGCNPTPSEPTIPPVKERQGWDNEWFPLRGDVESLCTVLYQKVQTPQGEIIEEADTMTQAFFNEQGDLLRKVSPSGEVRATYNKQGKLSSLTDFNLDGEIDCIRYYVYNAEGDVEQIRKMDGEGRLEVKALHTYNAEGQLIRVERFGEQGESLGFTQYTYIDGRLIEEQYYTMGQFVGSVLYRYDREGRVEEEVQYRSDNTAAGRVLYGYDVRGNLIDEKFYENGAEKPALHHTYTINPNDTRLTWSIYCPDEKGREKRTDLSRYSYDRQGNIILTEFYAPEGEEEVLRSQLKVTINYR